MSKIQTYIYKKKHKSGNVSYVVRFKDELGRWVSFSAGASKEEAKLYEAKVRQDLFSGVDPKKKNEKVRADVSLSEVIDFYCKQPRFLGLSEKWKETVTSFFENKAKMELGRYKLSQLKKDHAYKLYRKLVADGCSNATVTKYHHQLNAAIKAYCDSYPDFENPLLKIKITEVAPRQVSTREINFLTPDEILKILHQTAQSPSKLLHPLIQFLAFTGMRRSEALNLKWTDVDNEQGFFIIRDSKTKRPRSVPIEEFALKAIIPLMGNGEFVFTYKNGERPDEASFLRALKRNAKKVGIKKRIDLHTLRHSYGSNKIRSGWGLKKVSKILGHTDIQMTANVYSHLLDGDLKVQDELVFDNAKKNTHSLKEDPFLTLVSALKSLKEMGVESLDQLVQTKMCEMQLTRESLLKNENNQSAPQVLREDSGVGLTDCDKMNLLTGDENLMNLQPVEITNKKGLIQKVSSLDFLVEVNGFEPMTPCLQSRCSTN